MKWGVAIAGSRWLPPYEHSPSPLSLGLPTGATVRGEVHPSASRLHRSSQYSLSAQIVGPSNRGSASDPYEAKRLCGSTYFHLLADVRRRRESQPGLLKYRGYACPCPAEKVRLLVSPGALLMGEPVARRHASICRRTPIVPVHPRDLIGRLPQLYAPSDKERGLFILLVVSLVAVEHRPHPGVPHSKKFAVDEPISGHRPRKSSQVIQPAAPMTGRHESKLFRNAQSFLLTKAPHQRPIRGKQRGHYAPVQYDVGASEYWIFLPRTAKPDERSRHRRPVVGVRPVRAREPVSPARFPDVRLCVPELG